MTNLDSILKNRDITLPTKIHLSHHGSQHFQGAKFCIISSCHVRGSSKTGDISQIIATRLPKPLSTITAVH